jgi:p-methyltransferase
MPRPDCVVIGYNETPFPRFEAAVRRFGARSASYQDLRFSFVDVDGAPHTWIDLLNRTERVARAGAGDTRPAADYRCGDIPNLAAVYLTAFLRRQGLSAEYVNLFQFEQDWLRELLARDPVAVAITTTFYVTNLPAVEIVSFIREHHPTVPIVIGGPLVANYTRRYREAELAHALDGLGATVYIDESQGELTLAQVVACLKAGGDLRTVPNLVLPEGRTVVRTARVPESNGLDENAIDWAATLRPGAGATLQTRTARSCAFKCAFCAYPTRAGKLTLAGLETVQRELDSMLAYGGIRNVVFVDDTFNVPLPRFKQLCRMLIARRYPFRWYSYFRCNNADEEAVDLMAQSGCAGVFLGIESGSQPVLDNMNKAVTLAQYERGVQWLRQRDILTFGSFILGFPGETAGTVRDTIAYIRGLGLDYYRMQLWYCEPGTPIDGRRDEFALEGSGYSWRHRTMEAAEAMAHIHEVFQRVDEAAWLPQWSFDFWILPYLQGRGVPAHAFKQYMTLATQLLRLQITSGTPRSPNTAERMLLDRMADVAASWCAAPRAAAHGA